MTTLRTSDAPGLIRDLQERAARAFAAVVVEHLDGWWLRHTDSTATWWAGAVLPHGDTEPSQLPDKIRRAEEFCAAHGAPLRFQISPGACPAGLDDALAARGYRRECPMCLLATDTGQVIERLPAAGLRICIDDQPSNAWFAAWLAVHGNEGDPRPDRDMLRRVDRPSAYASVLTEDGLVAVGRAVGDTGWAGVFGMATLPESRRQSAAKTVLAALARWADDQGTGRMYLQVECHNTAARRLYEGAGFSELCRYHYRAQGREIGSRDMVPPYPRAEMSPPRAGPLDRARHHRRPWRRRPR
jgi:ribosomal protein S18 acetylase RimI-like enzyme